MWQARDVQSKGQTRSKPGEICSSDDSTEAGILIVLKTMCRWSLLWATSTAAVFTVLLEMRQVIHHMKAFTEIRIPCAIEFDHKDGL